MGHAPGNTVASFEKALELGCDEIETDVWLADDGRLLIAHDRPDLEASYPDLDDVLELCRGRAAVNVELKDEGDEQHARLAGAAVAARIIAHPETEAYVSSFWWGALASCREAAPTVRRAFVYFGSPDRTALIASARSLELWAIHPNYAYVTTELVEAAHAASLQVNAWTADQPAQIQRLIRVGVDGIMSSWPERVPKG